MNDPTDEKNAKKERKKKATFREKNDTRYKLSAHQKAKCHLSSSSILLQRIPKTPPMPISVANTLDLPGGSRSQSLCSSCLFLFLDTLLCSVEQGFRLRSAIEGFLVEVISVVALSLVENDLMPFPQLVFGYMSLESRIFFLVVFEQGFL